MNVYEQIVNIAHSNQGIITAKEITNRSIPRRVLTEMVEQNLLVKENRGIYCLPDAWEDEWMTIQYMYSRGIYSHDTALYLHGYTDRTPSSFTMTFPRGYHRKKDDTVLINEKYAIDDLYKLGITKLKSPAGNDIKAYDLEKSLCDIVRGNQNFDVEIVNGAMRKYAKDRNHNINKLMQYAKTLRVETKIRNYIEVLL